MFDQVMFDLGVHGWHPGRVREGEPSFCVPDFSGMIAVLRKEELKQRKAIEAEAQKLAHECYTLVWRKSCLKSLLQADVCHPDEGRQFFCMVDLGYLYDPKRRVLPDYTREQWKSYIQPEIQSLRARWKNHGEVYVPLFERWENWREANCFLRCDSTLEEFDPRDLWSWRKPRGRK